MRYVLHPWGPELVEPPPDSFDLLRRLALWSSRSAFVGAILGARLRNVRWSSLVSIRRPTGVLAETR